MKVVLKDYSGNEIIKIFKEYYLNEQLNLRLKAGELFNKDISKALNDFPDYCIIETCFEDIETSNLYDVIDELNGFILPKYGFSPELCIKGDKIVITYQKYVLLLDETVCERIATDKTHDTIWNLMLLPNEDENNPLIKLFYEIVENKVK